MGALSVAILWFLKYFVSGIFAIMASPVYWASFVMLVVGGISLYAFEVWLGYLFMRRRELSAKVRKLNALGYRAIHDRMDRRRFLEEYEALLEREREG